MDMSISKRDMGLLMGLGGLVVAFLAYRFAYQPFTEKKESLESQLVSLQQRETELENLEANMAQYQADIVTLGEANDQLLAQFPADYKEESDIMYGVALEDDATANGIFFTGMQYGEPEEVCALEDQSAAAADSSTATDDTETEETAAATDQTAADQTTNAEPVLDENGNVMVTAADVKCYNQPFTLTYNGTYQSLKDVINYTNEQDARLVIDELTAGYDESTGNLTGDIVINMYYMSGTNAVYEEPYVPNMKTGVSNPFHTIETPAADDGGVG